MQILCNLIRYTLGANKDQDLGILGASLGLARFADFKLNLSPKFVGKSPAISANPHSGQNLTGRYQTMMYHLRRLLQPL
jgi:hypothetical protein